MTSKSDKEKKSVAGKPAAADKKSAQKPAPKPKKDEDDDDDLDDEDIKPSSARSSKGSGKKSKEEEDDDEDAPDAPDDWEKPEEEESWDDPDFEEFDIPKSKGKKSTGTSAGKKPASDDDLSLDEDFKEFGLFNDNDSKGYDDDEDDDF